MLGGYQILDLSCYPIAFSKDYQNITEKNILQQLLNLREYIDNDNKIKPLLIRIKRRYLEHFIYYYDDISSWGNIKKDKENNFIISAVIDGTANIIFNINIEFETKLDEAENLYYDIKTAKYKLEILSHLYLHRIVLYDEDEVEYYLDIVNDQSNNYEYNPDDNYVIEYPNYKNLLVLFSDEDMKYNILSLNYSSNNHKLIVKYIDDESVIQTTTKDIANLESTTTLYL